MPLLPQPLLLLLLLLLLSYLLLALPLAPRCAVVHDEDSTIIAAWSMRFASGSVLLLALDLATPPDGSSPGHDFAATLAPSRL